MMKKAFLGIVAVAAGLFVASCGNKAEAPAAEASEGQQTEQTEQVAEAGTPAECDVFKVNLPEGWKFNENVSSEKVVHVDAPEFGQFESVHLYLNDEKTSADEDLNAYYNGNESTWKKADDITIGNMTFKRLDAIENSDVNCQLFADVKGGVLEVELSKNVPTDAASLKALIESFELK